jgi:hypothetical protein
MTHREACDALRKLEWRLRYGKLDFDSWAAGVNEVIAERVRSATPLLLAPASALATADPSTRKNTAPGTRHPADGRTVAPATSHAA